MQPAGRKWLNSVSYEAPELAIGRGRVDRVRSARTLLLVLTLVALVAVACLLLLAR